MSERNTGLFVAGHLPPERVAQATWSWPGIGPAELAGEELPRVGHGSRDGQPFTLVCLRLFEVGGLLLVDQAQPPAPDDLEQHLGRLLSQDGGVAVYLHYDEERGCGGHARFEDGRLASRLVYDGRPLRPVVRDLAGERPVEVADEEAWIWEDIAAAVEQGARPVLGPGVRTDDDLEALIRLADARPIAPPPPGRQPPRPDDAPPTRGRRQRLRGLLRRLAGDETP